MKPPIRTKVVSRDLGSSKTGREAALNGGVAVVTLVMIGAVGGVSAIQSPFRWRKNSFLEIYSVLQRRQVRFEASITGFEAVVSVTRHLAAF